MVSAPVPVARAGVRRGSGGNHNGYCGNRGSGSNGSGAMARTGSGRGKEKEVGQFALGKIMGEGTFGEVKLAVHRPTSERVAAKVLEKSRIKTIADVKRVSREIKILKRVRHPNVIALYEVLDTPSTIYFMMEHCDGGELFDYIVRHQRLQEGQACFFFRQLVDGIEYLHHHDVTHRDLKPENLLLQSSADGWRLKIIDFGLSNTHEGGKLLQTACGSPCYAAPEMIAGKSYRGPAADVWSCGVVLFTLVAGFLPFEDPNTSALYKKILSGSYEKPQWLSSGAVHLLSRILDTDPAKRAAVPEIRTHAWYVGAHPAAAQKAAGLHAAVPWRRLDVDDKLLACAVRLVNEGAGDETGAGKEIAADAIQAAAEGILSGRHDAIGTAYHLLLKRNLRGKHTLTGNPLEGAPRADSVDRTGSRGPQNSGPAATAPSAPRGTSTCDKVMVAGRTAVQSVASAPGSEAMSSSGRTSSSANGVVHGHASYASSTSSSRSVQPTARRRDPSTTVHSRVEVGVPRHVTPAPIADHTNGGNRSAAAASGPPMGPEQGEPCNRPASGRSAPRPSTAGGASETRDVAAVVASPWEAAAFETKRANHQGDNNVGAEPSRSAKPIGHIQRNPVPVLSLRAITRSGEANNVSGAGRGTVAVAMTTPLVSQTARASSSSGGATAATVASMNHRRGSHLYPDSVGSFSSNSSSGGTSAHGGSGRWKTGAHRVAAPRRPLTARAPLRSSSPTPRLSADFSLVRPRGAPIPTGGASTVGGANAISGSRVPTVAIAKATRPSTAGAPLAAERTQVVTERRPIIVSSAGKSSSKEAAIVCAQAPVSSVVTSQRRGSSHLQHRSTPKQQQPSLRVRLSTLSAKTTSHRPQQQHPQQNQRWRSTDRQDSNNLTDNMTGVVPAGTGAVTVRRPPRRPSSSFASSGNTASLDGIDGKRKETLPSESSVVKTVGGTGSRAIAGHGERQGGRPSVVSNSSSSGKSSAAVARHSGGEGSHLSGGGTGGQPHVSSVKISGDKVGLAGDGVRAGTGSGTGLPVYTASPVTAVGDDNVDRRFSAGGG